MDGFDGRADGELVRSARQGDKAAFGVLIDRYALMVRRLAHRMSGDAENANDLAQEALLQAFLSLDTLRVDERFRSWLYGITLNVCRSYLRSQRSDMYSLEVLLGGIHYEPSLYGPTVEEIVEQLEIPRLVMTAVEALSPANRAAVLLFY